MPADLPAYVPLDAELHRLGLAVEPAELHGALCGFLAGGGRAVRGDWLARVLPGSGIGAPAMGSPLDTLFQASLEQLYDLDLSLNLLLPDDTRPVAERADALLAWCRGFLGGFGLSGRGDTGLDQTASEALDDIGRIAASRIDYADPEEDDSALAEITEYVRVAVQLLFETCAARPPAPEHRLH